MDRLYRIQNTNPTHAGRGVEENYDHLNLGGEEEFQGEDFPVEGGSSYQGPEAEGRMDRMAGEFGSEWGENFGEDPNAGAELKNQIEEIKATIDASGMSSEDKAKKKNQLDGLLNLKSSDETDLQGTLESIRQEAELYKNHSPATIRLAQQLMVGGSEGAGGTPTSENIPEESTLKNIEETAKKHGVDLSNLPNPPTTEMIEFLKEVSPELKEKFDAVIHAAQDRQGFYETELTRAKAINEANAASGDDDDNKDISAHQHLYDLKYYQDEKSKTLVASMQDATKDFAVLYSAAISEKVDTVKPEAGAGWEGVYHLAKVADQISVGGNKLDLFNNTSGEAQVSTVADEEKLDTIEVLFDNGDEHKWIATGNGYGEDFKVRSYQEDSPAYDGFGSGIWAGIKLGWKYGGPFGVAAGAIGGTFYDVGKGVYHAASDLGDAVGLW